MDDCDGYCCKWQMNPQSVSNRRLLVPPGTQSGEGGGSTRAPRFGRVSLLLRGLTLYINPTDVPEQASAGRYQPVQLAAYSVAVFLVHWIVGI